MPIEKTETQTAETPKLVDLIAEAVSAAPEESPEATSEETPAEAIETEEAATPEEAATEESAAPEEAPAVEAVAESPDDAAVTKELADLGITKPDSQARFRELANEARDGRHYKEQYEKQNEVFDHLQRNGVTGDQFGALVGYASDVNSNDPLKMKRAYDVLQSELQGLASRLGLEAPGFDPLSAHPELAKKVETGELDRDTALAWAKERSAATLHAQTAQVQKMRETATQAEDRARHDLTELGNELSKRDPFYDKVYAMLVPSLRPVLARLPPSEWVAATADAYRDLRGQLQAAGQLVATPAQKPVVKRPDPANAGRPNGAAGSPEPKSGQDAILKMFGYSES